MGVRAAFSLITDAAAWTRELTAFGEAVDVYAERGYVHAASQDGEPFLAVVRQGEARLVVPLVRRTLPESCDQPEHYDCESPYGYPGIFTAGGDAELAACWEHLRGELARRRVVNLFLRLHPLNPQRVPATILLGEGRSTAVIPLREGRAQAFAGPACARHRANARRAGRLGMSAELVAAPDDRDLAAFRDLYLDAMRRKRADRCYRFDRAYFRVLAEALGERLALVTVTGGDGAVVARALFMRSQLWAHYHLGARTPEAHHAAFHLPFEAAADWAADHELRGVHLGGGMNDEETDPLWRFKRRVGRMRGTFRIAGLVTDPQRHQRLNQRWSASTRRPATRFQAYRQLPDQEDGR